jgi:Rrf2 family protein
MKISTKGQYGLRALVDLAAHDSGKPVLLGQIAERQQLSKRYLERLFTMLRDRGIVRSVRGAAGGYLMNRAPREIPVAEVLEVLEVPLIPVDCFSDQSQCKLRDRCITHELWVELEDCIRHTLANISLEDLRQRYLEMAKNQTQMYYI